MIRGSTECPPLTAALGFSPYVVGTKPAWDVFDRTQLYPVCSWRAKEGTNNQVKKIDLLSRALLPL